VHPFHLHFTKLHLHCSIATSFPLTSRENPSPLEHSYILSTYISRNSISTGAQLHPFHLHLTKPHLQWNTATSFLFASRCQLSLADTLWAILAALNNFYSPIWGHYTILSTDRLPHLTHTYALCPNYCTDHSKSTGNSRFLLSTYCWYWQIEWNLKFILKRQEKEKTATTRANIGSQVSIFIYLLNCGLLNDSVSSYNAVLVAPLSSTPQASSVRFLNQVCWHLVYGPPHTNPEKSQPYIHVLGHILKHDQIIRAV